MLKEPKKDVQLITYDFLLENNLFNRFSYRIVKNLWMKNFWEKDFSIKMPYVLVPVLNTFDYNVAYGNDLNFVNSNFLTVEESILELDSLNCKELEGFYKEATEKVAEEKLKKEEVPSTEEEYYNIFINKIDELLTDENGNIRDMSSFIKDMHISEKIIDVELHIYRELEENPWFFNSKDFNFYEIKPRLKGYNAFSPSVNLHEGLTHRMTYYPYYVFDIKGEKPSHLILTERVLDERNEGILLDAGENGYIFKNMKYLVNHLKKIAKNTRGYN